MLDGALHPSSLSNEFQGGGTQRGLTSLNVAVRAWNETLQWTQVSLVGLGELRVQVLQSHLPRWLAVLGYSIAN